ncbi:MAG: hypothetical protein ABSC37_04780 [Xanthobacteraceae bacterium]
MSRQHGESARIDRRNRDELNLSTLDTRDRLQAARFGAQSGRLEAFGSDVFADRTLPAKIKQIIAVTVAQVTQCRRRYHRCRRSDRDAFSALG